MGALTCTVGACSRLSDSGEGAKENRKAREKRGGVGRARASPPLLSFLPLFFFLFALSQFCGPDYLGAWNRLVVLQRGVG